MYDEAWTEPIACAFPIATRDFYHRGGLLPFFEHLAPEGWLRGRQARAGGTADQDDFGILLKYGADCIGAIGVLPIDQNSFPAAASARTTIEAAAATPGRTLSGVQKKLLAYRDSSGFHPSLDLDDPADYIVKFNRDDHPTLVQNESLSLRLAREILGGTDVTEAHPDTVQGFDGIALLVKRFDRVDGERLRLEDFAQILGKPRGRDFGGKYDSSYEEAATVIQKHSSRPRVDLDRYFRLVIFNLIIGNADAHLKNFSLLERDGGLRLSPAYDLVNTAVYPYEPETALAIDGRKRSFEALNPQIIEKLGTDIGLPPQAVGRALNETKSRFLNANTLRFEQHLAPDDFRAQYRDIVNGNLERILP